MPVFILIVLPGRIIAQRAHEGNCLKRPKNEVKKAESRLPRLGNVRAVSVFTMPSRNQSRKKEGGFAEAICRFAPLVKT